RRARSKRRGAEMSNEATLAEAPVHFDGATYEPLLDEERLSSQLVRVYNFMRGGRWHTLRGISEAVNGTAATVSARLRDLRKERFGGHAILRQRRDGGLFEYRME